MINNMEMQIIKLELFRGGDTGGIQAEVLYG